MGENRSRVGQIETSLDPLNADIRPIKPVRHIGVLVFKTADVLLYLADIVAHIIDRTADVAQMFEDDVVWLSHGTRISYAPTIVNHRNWFWASNGPPYSTSPPQ